MLVLKYFKKQKTKLSVHIVVSYSAVFNNILIIQDNMSGALEIFQCLGSCLLNLPQVGYKQSCIDCRLVFCKYLCLQPSHILRLQIKQKILHFREREKKPHDENARETCESHSVAQPLDHKNLQARISTYAADFFERERQQQHLEC